MWGLTWFRRRLHTAAILETVAMFVDAKRPITETLAGLAHWYPTRGIRHRLSRAQDDIQRGREWCEALAIRRLISASDRGVLVAAQRVGNLAWASSELADSNRRRYVTRATAIIQSAFVVILLGYGMLVAFFFIANFLPLIRLISSMT
jgi:type II secretory pathway component PulF